MNKKIIFAISITVVAIGAILISNTSDSDTVVNKEQTSVSSVNSAKRAGMPALDISRCSKQPNDAYVCPPEVLSDFGPVVITDTASGNTCEISYRVASGLSFKGKVKQGVVDTGSLAVALYPSGAVATVARSGAKTMSFHAREDGTLDHTLFVDSNYSTEQCLSVN